jgi:hypothetical protein
VSDGNNSVLLLIASTSLWQLSCLPPLEENLRDFNMNAAATLYNRIPVIRNLVVFFTSKKHVLIFIYIFIKKNENL